MKFRRIFRYDRGLRLLRLFRVTFARRSRQLTVGLTPHLWQRTVEFGGTILTVLGVRFHLKRGGVFAD